MNFRPRWPTPRELRVGLPVAIPLLVLSVFVVRGRNTGNFPNLHAPADTTASAPPPTTAPVDLTGVSIPGVDGTTTTEPVRATGTARLSGVVNGPQGPVPGATVLLEHLVSPTTSTTVSAGPDGTYNAPNIAGGRYRVRAYLAPSFAQTDPEVFFLPDGEQRNLDLHVDSFAGLAVTSAVAPDPPVRNEPVSLVVRVSVRTVDGTGIVRAQPVPNASVVLTGADGWSVSGSPTAVTDGSGDATFVLSCKAAGVNQVQVQVRATVNDQPQPVSLATSACVEPAPSASSSPSSQSSQPGQSSSSSSKSPASSQSSESQSSSSQN